jgi:hypothetical protein
MKTHCLEWLDTLDSRLDFETEGKRSKPIKLKHSSGADERLIVRAAVVSDSAGEPSPLETGGSPAVGSVSLLRYCGR